MPLIVISQMDINSQALSSRQRSPPSVYPSANGVRAPPHERKSRVKGASLRLRGAPAWALGWGAVREKIGFATGYTWSVVALRVRSSGQKSRCVWEAPLVSQRAGMAAEAAACVIAAGYRQCALPILGDAEEKAIRTCGGGIRDFVWAPPSRQGASRNSGAPLVKH